MKKALLIIALAIFLVVAIDSRQNANTTKRTGLLSRLFQRLNQPSQTIPKSSSPKINVGENPFGLMIPSAKFTTEQKINIATDLGATYFRPRDFKVDTVGFVCSECQAIADSGISLLLTVRNGGGGGNPSTPPQDFEVFRQAVTNAIDLYNPTVLIVENEENSMELFYSGTPSQYHEELKVACEVAHSKGTKCANGGFVSSLVAVLVANHYNELGETQKAEEYINRTVAGKAADQGFSGTGITLLSNPKAKTQIARGKELLAGYKSSGADYVNFHWYIADTTAFAEAVSYLESVTGLPAMSNEMGQQKNEDPAQVTAVMSKVLELGLPYAIWFSNDTQGFGGSRSLFDENGTLRPNGQAFRDFILEHF